MHYTTRTIGLLCELLHAPIQPDPRQVQQLHNRMFTSGETFYRDFSAGPPAITLSNPPARQGAASAVAFLPDRIQFREEFSGLTVEDFATRVHAVAEMHASENSIPAFLAQQVVVRTLVNPRQFPDSLTFMQDGVFQGGDQLTTFERPAQLYGVRLVFPPTEEDANAFAIRVESFNQDPRSLFIENQGSFGTIQVGGGLESLHENVSSTYGFILDRALRFVGRVEASQEDQ